MGDELAKESLVVDSPGTNDASTLGLDGQIEVLLEESQEIVPLL